MKLNWQRTEDARQTVSLIKVYKQGVQTMVHTLLWSRCTYNDRRCTNNGTHGSRCTYNGWSGWSGWSHSQTNSSADISDWITIYQQYISSHNTRTEATTALSTSTSYVSPSFPIYLQSACHDTHLAPRRCIWLSGGTTGPQEAHLPPTPTRWRHTVPSNPTVVRTQLAVVASFPSLRYTPRPLHTSCCSPHRRRTFIWILSLIVFHFPFVFS